jgi:hypothetical protein
MTNLYCNQKINQLLTNKKTLVLKMEEDKSEKKLQEFMKEFSWKYEEDFQNRKRRIVQISTYENDIFQISEQSQPKNIRRKTSDPGNLPIIFESSSFGDKKPVYNHIVQKKENVKFQPSE